MITVCGRPKGWKQPSSMREVSSQMALRGWVSVGRQKEVGRTFRMGGHEEMFQKCLHQICRRAGWLVCLEEKVETGNWWEEKIRLV